MSEPSDSGGPEPGSSLPNIDSNIPLPSILPSSRSLAAWAASCPPNRLRFMLKGLPVYAVGKLCPFCGTPIRCPSSDQSLIEHMKSVACQAMQNKLEVEILATTETPSTPLSMVSSDPSLVSHSTAAMPTNLLTCQGVKFRLPVSLWSNYSWHLHDPAYTVSIRVPFYICSINRDGDVIQLRNHACTGFVLHPELGCCDACAKTLDLRVFKSMMQRAGTETPTNGLNRKYYSFKQLLDLVEDKDRTIKKYRLKGIELNRNARRLLGKLSVHRQLVSSLAECDEVAVGRIVRVALRQGCGPLAIVDRLAKAQQGLYSCQDYSQKSLDMALLSIRLGGPRLLYALSKICSFPSEPTVNRHTERAYIRPSIAFPILEELLANIKSVCAHSRATTSVSRGFSLLIDEIATEERMTYSVAEDAILGLCREHASVFDTQNMTGRPISCLYDLKKLLDSGACHRAKEATVVSVAPFSKEDYSPKVILVSGTCKTESVQDQRSLIVLAIRAWNESPHGRSALGKLWSIATDGDPRRRQASHSICMVKPLPPTSPICNELCHLDLLNLMCGEDEITHDGDFKHEEKRLALALCSGDGVFVKRTHLSPMVIKQYLQHLPDMTPSRLDSLFNTSDRQDVPKAHALLKAIYDASRLPEIYSKTENQPFVLLGEFLNAFYAPQTTPSMSLSEQVASVAKCAFLLFAIFRMDWTRFISSQLYYDIQASAKNVVFCAAKTKVLDPTRHFYLLQLGDDRLENQFGIYRTLSGDRNLDILQLAERAGAVQQVTDILTKYPKADRKPYRISLEGVSGIDHLNPAGWIGDVCVGTLDLRSSWVEGRDAADQALRQAGIIQVFDPNALQAQFGGRDIDLMQPYGNYVGVTELESLPGGLSSSSVSVPALADPGPVHADACLPPLAPSSSCGDLAPSTSESHRPAINRTNTPDIASMASPVLAEDYSTDAELPLEYLLPPCMPAPEDDHVSIPESSGLKRGWVKFESRLVHLASATRLILGTESTEKSTDRLRRVSGFTRYLSVNDQSDSILGDLCLIGQIILALVRVDKAVALAAVRVTEIQTGKTKLESISMADLGRSDIMMSGQILALDYQDGVLYWNRSYILASANVRGKRSAPDGPGSTKPMLVKFPACLIEPVNPALSEHDGNLVWSFQQPELVAMVDLLWSKSSESYHQIPVCGSSSEFPYRLGHGEDRLVHRDVSHAIEGMPAEQCGICFLCGQAVPIEHYMRSHVAKHILTKRLNYSDPLVNVPIQNMPCGFCGRSGTCRTTLAVTKKSTSLKWSNCPHYDRFSYKLAETTTPTSPCTNRPILCTSPQCKDMDPIWSYNMRDHILASHGQSAFNHALNTGSHIVSNEEVLNLKLVDMLVVPGKSLITLRRAGSKRPYEDSTAPFRDIPEAPGNGAASGSGSKRVRYD
ncbi:hypothetical protein FRC08_006762 [Ceratobasidium sp. 394]|nr:hypothetical protein FRC08_006762 [Ceratobasidium sp. 394]